MGFFELGVCNDVLCDDSSNEINAFGWNPYFDQSRNWKSSNGGYENEYYSIRTYPTTNENTSIKKGTTINLKLTISDEFGILKFGINNEWFSNAFTKIPTYDGDSTTSGKCNNWRIYCFLHCKDEKMKLTYFDCKSSKKMFYQLSLSWFF